MVGRGRCAVGNGGVEFRVADVGRNELLFMNSILKPFCAKDLALTFITHADIFNTRKVRQTRQEHRSLESPPKVLHSTHD